MSRMVSFIVLLAIIVLIGVLFFRVMAGFWLPLFLAALLVVIFKPVHNWMLKKCNGRIRLAAVLTTLIILMVVLAPLAWTVAAAVTEAANLYAGPRNAQLPTRIEELRTRFHLDMPFADLLNAIDLQFERLAPKREEEDIAWSAYDWTDARTSLGRLHSACDTLATQLRVELAADAPDLTQSEAGRREGLHASIRQLQENMTMLIEMVSDQTADPDPQLYMDQLNQANLRFRAFRQTLLGGPEMAWLIDLANPSDEELLEWRNQATSYIQHWLLTLTGQTTKLFGSVVFGLGIMIVSVYYFLIDGPTLIKSGMRLSPLDDQYEEKLISEFDKISRAVVLATLLSAIAQGVLATVGYFFAGVNSLFLLFVLTTLLAMVPFIGSAAVWVPVCLWLAFVDGRVGAAIGLGVWGGLAVSMADNLIKPWVLHGQSNLHPLLGLLSVLGGVQALGPIGILVGPMVVAFLQALLNILQMELDQMERRGANTSG